MAETFHDTQDVLITPACFQINQVSNTSTGLKNSRLYIYIFVKCHKLFILLKRSYP